ncbi:MAG: hypothetical protein AAF809_05700, partial [Bacteroidota bacterium]
VVVSVVRRVVLRVGGRFERVEAGPQTVEVRGGDPAALVSHLLREDELSATDLDRLRARLDALEAASDPADDADDDPSTPTGATDV